MSFFTVGHSTRSLDELVALLHEQEITLLADVRTIPGSRRMPHFSRASLASALPERGIGYMHMPVLGGLRQPLPKSVNVGWRNMSFRGYADYMAQPEFRSGMAELIGLGREAGVAIMCAEAVPWRCHRSLIADALLIRGIAACHILGPRSRQPHRLTPFARADGDRLTYPIQEVRPETRPGDLGLRWSRSKEPPSTGLSVFDIRAGRSAEGDAGDGPHER